MDQPLVSKRPILGDVGVIITSLTVYSDNVPKSISNLLRLCTDEDIEVIKRMAQHIVNVRHNAEKSDK